MPGIILSLLSGTGMLLVSTRRCVPVSSYTAQDRRHWRGR